MSTRLIFEKERQEDFKFRKIRLEKIKELNKLSERQDIERLPAELFKSQIKSLRSSRDCEFFGLYLAKKLALVVSLRQSIFLNLSQIDLFKPGDVPVNVVIEGLPVVREELYKHCLDNIQINSNFSIPSYGLIPNIHFNKYCALLLSREVLNPRKFYLVEEAGFRVIFQLNETGDKITDLWVYKVNSTPSWLKKYEMGFAYLEKFTNLTAKASALVEDIAQKIGLYLSGSTRELDIPYKLPGGASNFQTQVWREIQNIPYGETASYEDIAIRVFGEAGSNYARAVGTACSSNPLMLIIPCQRVISAERELRGYLTGVETKAKLLDLELVNREKFN